MKKPKRLSIEKKLELAAERRDGIMPAELAERYGVSLRQVHSIIEKENNGTLAKRKTSRKYSFRAPPADVEPYLELAKSMGIDGQSNAFRVLFRMAVGLFEVHPVDLDAFNASVVELRGQRTLLNQIAHRVNKGAVRLTDDDREVLNSLAKDTVMLHEAWRAVIREASSRRGYVVKKLADPDNVGP